MSEKINAEVFRDEMWDLFMKAKNKEITHEVASASTAAARELLKSYSLEYKIAAMEVKPVGALADFFKAPTE